MRDPDIALQQTHGCWRPALRDARRVRLRSRQSMRPRVLDGARCNDDHARPQGGGEQARNRGRLLCGARHVAFDGRAADHYAKGCGVGRARASICDNPCVVRWHRIFRSMGRGVDAHQPVVMAHCGRTAVMSRDVCGMRRWPRCMRPQCQQETASRLSGRHRSIVAAWWAWPRDGRGAASGMDPESACTSA